MRRTITYPFIVLGLLIFCWINLPKTAADKIRSGAIAVLGHKGKADAASERAKLLLENQNLRAQLEHLYERVSAEVRSQLKDNAQYVTAQVIYRDPSSWSSSLWVNVGEATSAIVMKNSPVIADGALVGVVDYVGKKQARIRLITDSGLSPSVRVRRGKGSEDGYMAKGEVHGSSTPFWRSRSPTLKGIGFHHDHAEKIQDRTIPLLKEGDLLVTSGLDGVFPPDLCVGTVCWIDPLEEGGYAYNIEVRPAVNHLNDLQTVFILPAVGE